jgi:c-di-GMP-binding flagellar brake protein YcgR
MRVQELLKQKELERRRYRRVALTGKAEIQLLKASGTPVGGAFKGSLIDISMGGLCFLVRINKKETARLLLGQKMSVKFVHSSDVFFHQIEKAGIVVAVRSHSFEDYSVHVKFDELLHKATVADIENYPAPAVP